MLLPLRLLGTLLLVALAMGGADTAALAQVQDDFADGNFTQDPPWTGDADRFTVVPFGADFALRSDGLAEPDTIALATASDVVAGRWTFTFRWEANLTTANGTRFYLIASDPALQGEVEGYYVQLGTNNSDEVRLYRQDGAPDDRTELGASAAPLVAGDAGTVFVEVLRTAAGEWAVRVDGTPVITGVDDATYSTSSALGVWLKHSSATGAAFFWDDVLADPDVDTTPPELVSATAESPTRIEITFDEPVLGCDASLYTVTPGIGTPAGVDCSEPGGAVYDLLLDEPLTGPESYTVTASGVADLAGNVQPETSASFVFGDFETPAPGDIVINEVMYDPPDDAANEYVELYNRTADLTFDLSALRLQDSGTNPVPITSEPAALEPGGYAVLVRDPALFEARFPGVDYVAVDGFPALNNSGDTPAILSGSTVVDAVPYEPGWGGTDASLERRDPDGPSTSATNWATSTDPLGGTPGAVNSVFEPDTTPPNPIDADVGPEGQTITVLFDEPLDPATVEPGAFSLSGGAPAVVEAAYSGEPD
ncbi:MAG: lamin tail domain-containing protein, partial [Rhodothermales bacterium]|nr:lamin tail domain-containing protein [Rhodothermales bacterium]